MSMNAIQAIWNRWTDSAAAALVIAAIVGAVAMVFVYAPAEETMGEAQRIVYLHVSASWCGLAATLAMGMCGLGYLIRRTLVLDFWSQASAEIGCLCLTITLVTGSLWAHEAWGVWWTWEPRLTTALVLWVILGGIALARMGLEEPHARARVAAVLGLLAVCDLPILVMATRWFRGVHPVSPEMDPRMRLTLLAMAVACTAFFAWLVWRRRMHLELVAQVRLAERPAIFSNDKVS
jgi:heme exporter protein C